MTLNGFGVRHTSFLNGLSGMESACPPFSVLDCHAISLVHRVPRSHSPTVTQPSKKFGCQLGPRTLSSEGISGFVFVFCF